MPSPPSSAQATLQGLADRLRDLRLDAGLTGIALAAKLGWHRTKVSRLENAARPPSIAAVRAWCGACGADDQVDDLVAALRSYEGAYVQWQRLQRSGLRRLQESPAPLYERTRTVRVYSSSVMPGLVQTPGYISALLAGLAERHGTRNDVDAAVQARLMRQRTLNNGGHRFAFLVEESVLHDGLGGPTVMTEQLGHLLDVMTLPSTSFGIVPTGISDRRLWPKETFTMFDEQRVEIELLSARVSITAPSEIRLYEAAFEDVAAMAVYGRAARSLIEAVLAEFDT